MNIKKTFFERSQDFFNAIAFLLLPAEKKEEIAKIIHEDSVGDRLYWTELFLAALIATFGLLQNSVAVIIGAMLIAPLLRPIQAMAFGISIGNPKLFWRASFLLFASIFVAILIGCVSAFVISFPKETPEILARTTPNFLDFFIAIFSGMIAILSLSFSRLSSSVAGVAMAASLMPPLAVVGIEIFLGNFSQAIGSFMLFVTNLFAILLVGTFLFFFYGFSPHQQKNVNIAIRKIILLFASVILISIPLLSSLAGVTEKIKVQKTANATVEKILAEKIPAVHLDKLEVLELKNTEIVLSGTLRASESIEIFQEIYDEMQQELETQLHRKIAFQIDIIRTAKVISRTNGEYFEKTLKENIRYFFRQFFPTQSLVQLETNFSQEEQKWLLKMLVAIPAGEKTEEERKKEFETALATKFSNLKFQFLWTEVGNTLSVIVPQKEISAEEKLKNSFEADWNVFFAEYLPKNSNIEKFDAVWKRQKQEENEAEISKNSLEEIVFSGNIFVPNGCDTTVLQEKMNAFAEEMNIAKTQLQFRFFFFAEYAWENEKSTNEIQKDIVKNEVKK